MNVPVWIDELAGAFWHQAGEAGPFPRDLLGPATVVGISLVPLPGLRLASVTAWLKRHHWPVALDQPDRPLRALLAVNRLAAFVFLEKGDSEEEKRFSLAHELAHYLRDFWYPRQRACRHVGPAVLEVFDGSRSPSGPERLRGILADVPLDVHFHLLPRDADGKPAGREALAERDADHLAYELLAPADVVRGEGPLTKQALSRRLQQTFGLPPQQADEYAGMLAAPAPGFERWLARLMAGKKD